MESFLLVSRLKEILIIFCGSLILFIAVLRLASGTESKALAISKDAIQICSFKLLAILIVEDIIDRGSIVLWLGRPAKLAEERILLKESMLDSLLLRIL